MAQQSYKKFVASAATATLVASALVPVASAANVTTSAFTDVPASYKDAVDFVVTNNISKGLTETQYGISQQIKRGDAALMIANAAGLNDKDAPASGFSDVPTRAAIAINSLKAAGVISGKSTTKFGFQDNITRGEAALMLQKAFKLEAGDVKNSFTDVSSRYDDAVDALVANKVTSGINKTQFGTTNNIKRGDFAKFLYALEGKIVKLEVESLKANSTTSFDVVLKEALPADADLKELLKVKVVLKDGTIVTPEATDVKVSEDRKTITVEHKNNDLEGLAGTLTVNGKNLEFNYVKEEAGSLKVESVKAINLTDVTVGIEAPTTDMVDAVVVVKDAAGKVVPTKPVTIKAGATEATFSFVNPITVSPTSQWTVNGVAYAPANLEIVDVDAVTPNGKYLEVLFNKPLTSLEASEISIRNSNTLVRVGVEKVKLASDGMSAQVTLLGSEDAETIINRLTSYDFTLTQNGKVTSKQFTLPGYITEKSVTDVDAKERTITINSMTLKIPTTMAFDFEEALGREVAVWYDKDNNVTKFNIVDQAVKFDGIKKVETKADGFKYVTLASDNKEYRVAKNKAGDYTTDGNLIVKDATGNTSNSLDALAGTHEYAKLVLDKSGYVKTIVANTAFTNEILVDKTVDNTVQGYGNELNLKDYTIVKDGKTIKVSDIKAGDLVFYDTTSKFAEVNNQTATDKVSSVFANGEFKLGDKVYSIAGAKTIVDGKEVSLDQDTIEAIAASDKAAKVYFNRLGEVVFVTGELGEVVTNTNASYLTANAKSFAQKATPYLSMAIQNSKGVKSIEEIEVAKLKSVTVDGTTYKVGAADGANKISKFVIQTNNLGTDQLTYTKVNEDGDAAGSSAPIATLADFAKGDVVEVTKDTDGVVVGLNVTTTPASLSANAKLTNKSLATDYAENNNLQIMSTTPVFIKNADGSITSTTWGELSSDITEIDKAGVKVYAKYITGTDQDVASVVIPASSLKGADEATEKEAVVADVRYNTDSEIAYLKLAINGEVKEYAVGLTDATKEFTTSVGKIVKVEINNKTGKVQTIATSVGDEVPGTILASDVKVAEKSFVLNGKKYEVGTKGVQVYKVTGTGLNKTVEAIPFSALADLKAENNVVISTIAAGSSYVDTIVVTQDRDITVAPTAPTGLAFTSTPATSGNAQLTFTAPVGSTVAISVDDTTSGTAPVVTTVQGTGGVQTVNIDVSSLTDTETLTATVKATNNIGTSSSVTATSVLDKSAPTVTSALTGVQTINNNSFSVTFSEDLNAASKTAVEDALKAVKTGTGVVTYTWSDNKTLVVKETSSVDAVFTAPTGGLKATIKDVVGNTTADAVLVTP